MAQVHAQRTKKEYTAFCQALAAAWPDAAKIRLMQDNLNTHNASAFYDHLPADQAFAVAQRFEFVYTPKSASGLNMIELAFSALARLCLDRRIPSQTQLEHEVLALVRERHAQHIKLHWQFTIEAARPKLASHYHSVNSANPL